MLEDGCVGAPVDRSAPPLLAAEDRACVAYGRHLWLEADAEADGNFSAECRRNKPIFCDGCYILGSIV
jgi:hypothetical protein